MGLLSTLRYYVTQIAMYVPAGLDSFKNSSNDGTTEKAKLSSSSRGEILASLSTSYICTEKHQIMLVTFGHLADYH